MYSSRREFLKRSMAALTGLPALPAVDPGRIRALERKLIFRTLGKTGLRLPIVSMGIYDNTDLVPYALRQGITHFQTSGVYRRGNSERAIGAILRDTPRGSFVLATGTSLSAYTDPGTLTIRRQTKPEAIQNLVEESLRRLNFDYVDIYYLGDIASKEMMLYEPFVQVLNGLKRAGKIRFLGVAAHTNEPAILRAAADSDFFDVAMIGYNFLKTNAGETRTAAAYAAGKGLGVVAMKTQAGVYFDKSRRRMINMKAALKWALQDENFHTSVPAFSNIQELEEDISVMENPALTPAEREDLKTPAEAAEGIFCQQCRACIPQCSNPFDIPAVMRSYMYLYGYSQWAKAGETFASLNLGINPCADCAGCRVTCSMGFDVKRKVTDLFEGFSDPGRYHDPDKPSKWRDRNEFQSA